MSAKDKKTEKQIHEMEQHIEQITAEKQELLDKLQRLSADYTNYQKRVPKQVADSVAYEKRNLVRSLLPSLDNFDHAFSGFSAAQNDEAAQNIIKGVRLIFDHMLDALKTIGLEKVSSTGQDFDPSRHEAMMHRAEFDKDNGVVLEEYLPCYLLGGDVLRPAKVIVNKLPDIEDANNGNKTTDIETEEQ